MRTRGRFRVVAVAVTAALVIGAVLDPAYGVATALPTGTIKVGSVFYLDFANSVAPAVSTSAIPAGFGIRDVGEDDGGFGFAYDGGFHLTLNGRVFKDGDDSVDISSDAANLGATGMLLTASGKAAGLKVTARIGMFSSSERTRVLYRIKNPGTRKRTVTSTYTSDFGSDLDTVVEDTSNGNDDLQRADSWAVTSNDGTIDDDSVTRVVVTTVWGDASGEEFFFSSSNGGELGPTVNDVFQIQHRFTIRPGKTKQLLFFHQFEDAVSFAETEAEPEFDTLATLSDAGLLGGLSGNFVNWVPVP